MGAAPIFFVVIVFSISAFTSQIKAKQVIDQSENKEAEINTDAPEEKKVLLENNAKEGAPPVPKEEVIDETTEFDYKTKLDLTEDKQILKRSSGELADDAAGIVVNSRNSLKNKDESKSSEILSETDIAKKSDKVLANDNKTDIPSDKKETKIASLLDESSESDKEDVKIAHSETTPGAGLKDDSDNIDTHLKYDNSLDDNNDESKVEEESDLVDLASADNLQSRRTMSAGHPEIVDGIPKSDVLKTGTVGAVFNLPGALFRNINGFNNDLGSKRSYPNEINTPRLLFQPAASITYHRPINTPAPLLNRFSTPDVANSSPLINTFSSQEVINSTPRYTKRLNIPDDVNSAPPLTRFPIQDPAPIAIVTNPTLLFDRFPAQEVANPTLFNRFAIPEGVNSNSFLQRHPPEYSESRTQNQLWSESTTNSYPFSPTTTQNLNINGTPFNIFSKLTQASENTGPHYYHGNFYKPFDPNYNIHNYNPFIS